MLFYVEHAFEVSRTVDVDLVTTFLDSRRRCNATTLNSKAP